MPNKGLQWMNGLYQAIDCKYGWKGAAMNGTQAGQFEHVARNLRSFPFQKTLCKTSVEGRRLDPLSLTRG